MNLYDSLRGGSLVEVPSDLSDASSPRSSRLSYRVLKGRLLRAAVAFHASGDERAWAFASETIDFLLRPECWELHSLGCRLRFFDLKRGDLIYCVVFALEAFSSKLDSGRRNRLIELLIKEGMGAYLKGWESREWWREATFNWGTATHGNAGLGALALAEIDPSLSRNVLAHVREGLRLVIDNLPQDGWWTEGAMYHTTTLGHLSDFVIALHGIEGDDLGLSENPRWIEALESRPYCLAPDGRLFNFSNCPTKTTEWYLPHAYWWAERLNRPEWIAFEDSICKPWSHTTGVFYDIEAFLFRPAHPQPTPRPAILPLRHFRGLDWLTWRTKNLWLAFRSGNNGGNHNNLDLGHFILGRGQTRYLIDPGYVASLTSQHNAVTVRGHNQCDAATARITRFEEFEGGWMLSCDLRECFPHVLETYMRYLVVFAEDHVFLIDDLRGKNGTRVSARHHFQTDLPVETCERGCAILSPEGTLSLTSLTGHEPPELCQWQGPEGPATCVAFHSKADLAHEVSVFRLSFDETSAPRFAFDEEKREIKFGDFAFALNLKTGRWTSPLSAGLLTGDSTN